MSKYFLQEDGTVSACRSRKSCDHDGHIEASNKKSAQQVADWKAEMKSRVDEIMEDYENSDEDEMRLDIDDEDLIVWNMQHGTGHPGWYDIYEVDEFGGLHLKEMDN